MYRSKERAPRVALFVIVLLAVVAMVAFLMRTTSGPTPATTTDQRLFPALPDVPSVPR